MRRQLEEAPPTELPYQWISSKACVSVGKLNSFYNASFCVEARKHNIALFFTPLIPRHENVVFIRFNGIAVSRNILAKEIIILWPQRRLFKGVVVKLFAIKMKRAIGYFCLAF